MKAKVILTGLAVLGVVAFAVAPASALAGPIVRHVEGKALPIESPMEAFSGNLTFTVAPGEALECSENELVGTLTANGGPTQMVVEEASFTGGAGPNPGDCFSPILIPGGGGATFTMEMKPIGLPWRLTLNDGSIGELAGIGPDERVGVNIVLYAGSHFVASCTYQATELNSLWFGGPSLEDEFVGQELKLESASSSETCFSAGDLNGVFILTSNGSELEVA